MWISNPEETLGSFFKMLLCRVRAFRFNLWMACRYSGLRSSAEGSAALVSEPRERGVVSREISWEKTMAFVKVPLADILTREE